MLADIKGPHLDFLWGAPTAFHTVLLGKNKKTTKSMIMMVRINSSILNVNARNTGKEKFEFEQCIEVKNAA